jgi:hypothetical protein
MIEVAGGTCLRSLRGGTLTNAPSPRDLKWPLRHFPLFVVMVGGGRWSIGNFDCALTSHYGQLQRGHTRHSNILDKYKDDIGGV